MGQQQLLLVILVTIIVGIATVVAINTFSSASDSSNVDMVRNDVVSLAASAQGYYMKPAMLGGGGNSFNGITFNQVAFPTDGIAGDGLTAFNSNGHYTIAGTDTTITVTAIPSSRADGPMSLTSGLATDEVALAASITPNGITWTANN
tara:strand:+ start:8439 stop:8882 length:444 start_codon:yes stop_codon:yes gene_type:complete